MKENVIEACYDPSVGACIISEYRMDDYVGNKPQTPTDTPLRNPSGLHFECWRIVRDMPIIINEIEMHLNFYVYPNIDFGLLLGYPLE